MIFIFLSESFRGKETKQKTFWISEPLVLDEHQSQFFMPESPGEPEFADSETNVTAQLGGSVFLHCPVINSGDRAVSYPSVSILKKWMKKEIHLFLGMTGIFSEPLFFFHLHSSFEWSFSVAAFHYFYRAWNWIFNFVEKEKKWLN